MATRLVPEIPPPAPSKKEAHARQAIDLVAIRLQRALRAGLTSPLSSTPPLLDRSAAA